VFARNLKYTASQRKGEVAALGCVATSCSRGDFEQIMGTVFAVIILVYLFTPGVRAAFGRA
jgi:hypothetical protein